ncbi:hypothetical protein Hdeb2414_s0001g00036261 [Helianthus debilis subsp. tardiflorus]
MSKKNKRKFKLCGKLGYPDSHNCPTKQNLTDEGSHYDEESHSDEDKMVNEVFMCLGFFS